MSDHEWEIGMKVVVSGGGAMAHNGIGTVTKITRTGQVTVDMDGYSRKFRNGREINGDRWWRKHICPATDEDINRITFETRKRELCGKLSSVKYHELSLETLEKIWEIIEIEPSGNAG